MWMRFVSSGDVIVSFVRKDLLSFRNTWMQTKPARTTFTSNKPLSMRQLLRSLTMLQDTMLKWTGGRITVCLGKRKNGWWVTTWNWNLSQFTWSQRHDHCHSDALCLCLSLNELNSSQQWWEAWTFYFIELLVNHQQLNEVKSPGLLSEVNSPVEMASCPSNHIEVSSFLLLASS